MGRSTVGERGRRGGLEELGEVVVFDGGGGGGDGVVVGWSVGRVELEVFCPMCTRSWVVGGNVGLVEKAENTVV